MKTMPASRHLDEITVTGFLSDFRFREMIIDKLNDLNPADPAHQSLEAGVRLLMDMVEEGRAGRYARMPLVLFARAIVELDHFVRIQDGNADTRVDGYLDDLSRINTLCMAYAREIDAFRQWRKDRHPVQMFC